MSIKQSLSTLPTQPGVYKMLDVQGDVLYVGKALNLKKRVSSYFSRSAQSTKNRSLISQIASFDVTVTRSEMEALILENSWIKLFQPKYNILMRDDKTYPFIYLSEHPFFPSIGLVRRKKKPNSSHYFGPYPSTAAVHKTLNLIQKLFKIRNCSDLYFNTRSRPCLQYQIKRCSAPCVHLMGPQPYQQSILDAKRFLQGKSQQILDDLSERMQIAVENLAYEEAAILRDQIKHLRVVQEEQAMVQASGDVDIIVLEAHSGFSCVQLTQIRRGEVVASDHYFPAVPAENLENDQNEEVLWQRVFHAFLAQIYFDTPDRIPKMVLTDRVIQEKELLQSALTSLRGKRCQIKVAQRGLVKRWLDFALQNLQLAVSKHTSSQATMQARMVALAQWLHLPQGIRRMECFDISHFQGDATVASCVVFDEQGPVKRAYRRFNIQDVAANDDYAAMEQVLLRRYQKMEQDLPDLLIVDGGQGQVNIARRVLATLGIQDHIAILGVAKGRTRKSGWETFIFASDQPNDEILPEHSPVRHLIQFIRDEAHRFAIQAHRNKRDKSSLSSTLESIEGIGPKRRKALLQRFGGMRELRRAPIDELMKVRGISQDLAKKIYAYLHG
ncbi:MAG: excinuclease ABC subunit UvrC [Legionellales bacterium]|nr:excinuclease ABC subunit UvrC [Legionellales bacterium]